MDDLYKQAVDLQHKFRTVVDQKNTSKANELAKQIQGLEDDLQQKKNRNSLESRVQTIIRILDSLQDGVELDSGDIDDLKDRAEDMRNQIRKL